MNKTILIAPVVAVLLVGAISTITTGAQASIFGNFGSGYDAGKSAGYKAFFQGSSDASCPYDFSTYPTWVLDIMRDLTKNREHYG